MNPIPANWSQLLSSWSEELFATTNRIHSLIGNKHQPTKGNYHEALLRKMLQRLLPKRYRVSTGFIYRWDGAISSQLDILIWDAQEKSAILEEGELVILGEDAVDAVIEVKATLDVRELRKGLKVLHPEWAKYWPRADSITGLRQNLPPRQPPFRAIFAFQTVINTKRVFKELSSFYRSRFGSDAKIALNLTFAELSKINMADAICCAKNFMLEQGLISYRDSHGELVSAVPGFASFGKIDAENLLVGRFCMLVLSRLLRFSVDETVRNTIGAELQFDKPGICCFGGMDSQAVDIRWWGRHVDSKSVWFPSPLLFD